MSAPRKTPLARVAAIAFAAALVLVLGSFVLARRAARGFFRDTAAFLGEVHTGPNWLWWSGPLGRGFAERAGSGPWRAWSCGTSTCDFAPAIELSLTGRVVRSVPSDLARRLADERTLHHGVLYALLVPGERVRAALPPIASSDVDGPMWDATLPDGSDPIVIVDRGAVTLLRLPDPWDLAAATERPPRLARFDAWLRRQFAGRHIICGDETVLLEGLPPGRTRHLVSDREGAAFLKWLDRQPHDGWRVIN